MALRSARSFDTDVVSFGSSVGFSGVPNLAQQHFRDECDINVMIARFQRTGVPSAPPSPPTMADFDEVFDFQSAMQTIIDARSSFMSLPAKVRARFSNDPQQFLSFVYDGSNREEAIRLGLIEPAVPASGEPAAPAPTEPASPASGDVST